MLSPLADLKSKTVCKQLTPRPIVRRRWTKSETRLLWQGAGVDSVRVLARRLGRTERAVRWRMGVLGMSAKVKEGWSQRELARTLHVGPANLRRRIRAGEIMLRDGRIREPSLRCFVGRHAGGMNWALLDPETRQWLATECRLSSITAEASTLLPTQKHALVMHDCPGCRERKRGNAYFRHRKCCPRLESKQRSEDSRLKLVCF
jgi:hypothetical protein